MGCRPYGQRKPDVACQPRGAQARAHHGRRVLFAAGRAEHFHRAAARRVQRDDLVGDHRVTQCFGQALDRGTGADGAPVLIEHREAAVVGEQRHASAHLGAVHGPDCYATRLLQNAQSPRYGTAQGDHSVLGDQFGAQPVGPLVPDGTALPGEFDEAGVVVRVAEDAGLATGLSMAWKAALVHPRRRSTFGQCVGGAEADDTGSYHGNLGNPSHSIASLRVEKPSVPLRGGGCIHLSPPQPGGLPDPVGESVRRALRDATAEPCLLQPHTGPKYVQAATSDIDPGRQAENSGIRSRVTAWEEASMQYIGRPEIPRLSGPADSSSATAAARRLGVLC
ncbi:hypothetical protein RKD41_000304 [Streptomyces tendae]